MKLYILKKILPVMALLICSMSLSAEVYRSVYKGKIAGKNVRAEIYLDDEDYSVKGTYYYYNSDGERLSSDLNLKGVCNPIGPTRNIYTLTEYTPEGTYSGTWNANFDVMSNEMTGTITNKKAKSYSINLVQTN